MLDDLECPRCQVLLQAGTHICKKCGQEVQPGKTGIAVIDIPRKVYSLLVDHLGHIGANIVAGIVCITLFALVLVAALIRGAPSK